MRKRPAESGIGFCLPPVRAWLQPAPFPGSLSVCHSRPTRRTTIPTAGRKKRENAKFTTFHNGEIHQKGRISCVTADSAALTSSILSIAFNLGKTQG